MDALFDSWDPDRVGAIEMDELCKRLRGADVHKGAESPLSLSGRACGKDTSDASPTASRRKSNASAASVQQQKNLERDRKVLFQRKMDAAARVTARREVDRQLLRDVTKLYAVYLQKCTYAAYTPPTPITFTRITSRLLRHLLTVALAHSAGGSIATRPRTPARSKA